MVVIGVGAYPANVGARCEGLLLPPRDNPRRVQGSSDPSMCAGLAGWQVASNNMNATSSRGHMTVTVCVVSKRVKGPPGNETLSKLHLVDLAGSERNAETGNEVASCPDDS